jgi:hypothetical protein
MNPPRRSKLLQGETNQRRRKAENGHLTGSYSGRFVGHALGRATRRHRSPGLRGRPRRGPYGRRAQLRPASSYRGTGYPRASTRSASGFSNVSREEQRADEVPVPGKPREEPDRLKHHPACYVYEAVYRVGEVIISFPWRCSGSHLHALLAVIGGASKRDYTPNLRLAEYHQRKPSKEL